MRSSVVTRDDHSSAEETLTFRLHSARLVVFGLSN